MTFKNIKKADFNGVVYQERYTDNGDGTVSPSGGDGGGVPTGGATEAKQDAIITAIEANKPFVSATGTMGAQNDAVTADTDGFTTVDISVSPGSWGGTVVFEAISPIDGSYVAFPMTRYGGGARVSQVVGPAGGKWTAPCEGATSIRARASTAITTQLAHAYILATRSAGLIETEVPDGANIALGAKADTAWATGAGSVIAVLKNIAGALAGLLSVTPKMTGGGTLSATSNASGALFVPFGSQACKQLTVMNNTGQPLEFQQGAETVYFPVPDGMPYTFYGLTNANTVSYRRIDASNVQVTLKARWEA